jgi:hypothetical protein
MIKKIIHNNTLLALIIKSSYSSDGIEFFTPPDYSQQLAYMQRPKGYLIEPHVHNFVHREVTFTQEVLYIKSGAVRIDFFDELQNYLESYIVKTGDVVMLAFGGHGFEMLEQTEMIEVKQGPYLGAKDKTRFGPVTVENVHIKE